MTAPRTGCQTCKTRRVKCDGTRPICQRCTRSKRICIAASTIQQPSFAIHNENQFASGTTKRPRGPRSKLTVRQPQADLETRAAAYYFQYHLQVITDAPIAAGGLSECVAAWKSSGRQDEMVDLALASMALAVYSRTQNEPQAATEAFSKYYKLLKIVQARINKVELLTLSEQEIDACLLTIFLMGRYEGIMHEHRRKYEQLAEGCIQGLYHHDGAMAILEVWSNKLSPNRASEIVKQTRRGQIRSMIMRNRPLPEWLHDGSRYGEQGRDLDYDRHIVRIVKLRDAVADLHKRQDVPDSDVRRLSQEAQTIDDALCDWMSPLTKECPRHKHRIPISETVPMPHFFSRTVYSYSSPGQAAVWSQYYGARILLNSIHGRLLELEGEALLFIFNHRSQRQECLMELKSMANDLASTVPFILNRFRRKSLNAPHDQDVVLVAKGQDPDPCQVGLLFWPLTVASSVNGIEKDLQRWFRSELKSAGKVIGDSVLSETSLDEWPFSC